VREHMRLTGKGAGEGFQNGSDFLWNGFGIHAQAM
jgi:hypothetical protein